MKKDLVVESELQGAALLVQRVVLRELALLSLQLSQTLVNEGQHLLHK
jgi:hypothetical protein